MPTKRGDEVGRERQRGRVAELDEDGDIGKNQRGEAEHRSHGRHQDRQRGLFDRLGQRGNLRVPHAGTGGTPR